MDEECGAVRSQSTSRSLLVDVDDEGLALRNLSCHHMGLRELLYCEGVAEVAQCMARPTGFFAVSCNPAQLGYDALVTGFEPTDIETGCALNGGWELVSTRMPVARAYDAIENSVRAGHPVLVRPAEFRFGYYPDAAPRDHVAIVSAIEGGEALVHDDLEIARLPERQVWVTWDPVDATGPGERQWLALRRRPGRASSWAEVLSSLLGQSIAAWSVLDGGGLERLAAFGDWLSRWAPDLRDVAQMNQLTSLFLGMRFEMAASHHVLGVALRRTEGLGASLAASALLEDACKRWNSAIFVLVGCKLAGEVTRAASAELAKVMTQMSFIERRALEALELCLSQLRSPSEIVARELGASRGVPSLRDR